MKRATTITSKGQVTIPADIRRQLGLQPGQSIQFEIRKGEAVVKAHNWQTDLSKLQRRAQAHLKKRGVKPLSDAQLNTAIDEASATAASRRYQRSR